MPNKGFAFFLLLAILFLQGCAYSQPKASPNSIVDVCKPANTSWLVACAELDEIILIKDSGEEVKWSLRSKNPHNQQAAFVLLNKFGDIRCYLRTPSGDEWFIFSCVKGGDPDRYFFETYKEMKEVLMKSIASEA